MRSLSLIWCICVTLKVAATFNLTILHTNDIHARFEQTNKYSGRCSEKDQVAGKCFGGTARLVTKVRERRELFPNSVLLSAGDEYSGTLWFYAFGGQVTATFMNHLGYDAMALGNHEFDLGIDGLLPLLDGANFPIVSANIDTSREPRLAGKLGNHHVINVGGDRVGVIGYTTRETPEISVPGPNLVFNDEVARLQEEVSILQAQSVNKIIALGHSGFHMDQKIAAEVTGLDIVIGGHTNTFLYTGDAPSNDKPVGEYPHVVTQTNGAKVLVVQDYAFGKYLGELHVTFDPQGEVTGWGGNPILLDNSTARDEATLEMMQPYKEKVANTSEEVVAKSLVFLDGRETSCRVNECNLGNLIVDAMVHQNLRHSDSLEWNHVAIAMMNGGGIRSSLPKGDITIGDILSVLPFRNTVDIVELSGKHLRATLEYGASRWSNSTDSYGGFMQVSGLRVVYDMTRPKGERVQEVEARCARCPVPLYEKLDDSAVYKIIMSSFVANGGDGYAVIKDNKIAHHLLGDVDADVLVEYVKSSSPLYPGLEGRIVFRNTETGCQTNGSTSMKPAIYFLVLFLLFSL